MGLLNSLNKLLIKPWIRADFFQLPQGLPDTLKLHILSATGPAAQKVVFDLFLFLKL
jgi:hypothetical protein